MSRIIRIIMMLCCISSFTFVKLCVCVCGGGGGGEGWRGELFWAVQFVRNTNFYLCTGMELGQAHEIYK